MLPWSVEGIGDVCGTRFDETDGIRSRQLGRIHLERIERQRAGDEQRSKPTGRYHGNSTGRVGEAVAVPSSDALSDAIGRKELPLQLQQHPSSIVREGRLAFQAGRHGSAGSNRRGCKVRLWSAGGGNDRGNGGVRPELLRKRPASAEIVRERHQEERTYLDKMSYAGNIPDAAEPNMEPTWHGRDGVNTSTGDLKLEPRRETGSVGQQWRPPDSRRPKSAYPRLEDGGQPGDNALSGIGSGNDGSRGGSRNTRANRARARSARARNSASEPMFTTTINNNGKGNNQRSRRQRDSTTEDRSNRTSGIVAESVSGQSGVRMTKLSQARIGKGVIDDAGLVSSSKKKRSGSSASAAQIDRARINLSTSETTKKKRYVPTNTPSQTGRSVAGRTTNSKGVMDGPCVRRAGSPGPQTTTQTNDEQQNQRKSSLDNGRDGKLYLDFESDNYHAISAPLKPKLNVMHKPGEEEAVEGQVVNGVRIMEATERGGADTAVAASIIAASTNDMTEVPLVAGASKQRAEAARTIQKALVCALRQRSGDKHKRKGGRRAVLGVSGNEDGGRGEAKNVLPNVVFADARCDHQLSGMTGETGAQSGCVQARTASIAASLKVGGSRCP